jgi:membrane protease YdiL (CAAX protease family)
VTDDAQNQPPELTQPASQPPHPPTASEAPRIAPYPGPGPVSPTPPAEPVVGADHVPFARLVISVGSAALLGVFVIAVSATVGVAAGLVVDKTWPDWAVGLTYFGLITASYAVQVLAVYVLARRRGLRFAPAVGLNPFPLAAGILAAVVVSFAGRLLAGLAAAMLQALGIRLPQPTTDPTAILGSGPISVVLILVLLMVVAPFAEEVVFRGVIMASLHRRFGPVWAIAGSGLLFALVHVQPATVFAIVFVGLALGWVAMRYRSIWPSIIAHSLFNGVSAGAIFWLRGSGRL